MPAHKKLVTITVNGEKRKLFVIKDEHQKQSLQVINFSGIYHGDGQSRPIGTKKYSVHPPRDGVSHVIHFKVTQPNQEKPILDGRHYTQAMTLHNSFAHMVSTRHSMMAKDMYEPSSKFNSHIEIPENFDRSTNLLFTAIFVGNLDAPFERPEDELNIKHVRIDCKKLSVIILYYIVEAPGMDFSYYLPTVTKNPATSSKDDVAQIAATMKGCTPQFAVQHFAWHILKLQYDYYLRWIKIARELQVRGLSFGDARSKIQECLMRMTDVEQYDELRVQQGRGGRYFQD